MEDDSLDNISRNPYPDLFNELTHLRAIYERALEVYPIARAQFIKAIGKARNVKRPADDANAQHQSIPPMDAQLMDEAPTSKVVDNKDVKKMFRQIAKETHPDAIPATGMTEVETKKRVKMFQEARLASEDNDWYSLFKIADELGIALAKTLPEYRQVLKLAIKSIKENIAQIYNDPAWVWYHTHPSKKSKIINHFIQTNV